MFTFYYKKCYPPPPSIENGVEFQYFSKCCIKVEHFCIVTTQYYGPASGMTHKSSEVMFQLACSLQNPSKCLLFSFLFYNKNVIQNITVI